MVKTIPMEKYVFSPEQLDDPYFRAKLPLYKTARLLSGEFVSIVGIAICVDGFPVVVYRRTGYPGEYSAMPKGLTDFVL